MDQALKIFKVSFILAAMYSENVIAEGQELCYSQFGCFDANDPWNQPIFSLLPQAPDIINTTFKLYNSEYPEGVIVDHNSNDTKRGEMFVILVHGLDNIGGHDNEMYTIMRPELLERRNADNQTYLNVITVDWSRGIIDNNLIQSIGNSRLVSAQLAYLIKQLRNRRRLRCRNIHIIGFSVGASMAGLVGKQIKNDTNCKIERITGLDPVRDGYETIFAQLNAATRLKASDANIVDVIHTHTRYQGLLGKVNFYPNGGFQQTGCPERDTNTIGESAACNHFRAVKLFSSTIRPNGTHCVGFRCKTIDKLKKGRCSNHTQVTLGFETNATKNGPRGVFFLETNDADPYCGNFTAPSNETEARSFRNYLYQKKLEY